MLAFLQRRSKRTRLAIKLGSGLVALALFGFYVLPFAFPVPEGVAAGPETSTVLLDRNGQQLDHLVRGDYYRHRASDLDDLPQDLINATLAAEDKRFYDHGGVDFRATARAVKDSWEAERFVSGASTITQQTVKLTSNKSSRGFVTKVRECLTARHVEFSHSKEEILTAYFNHLDYGNRAQGPLQAARHYFGKPLHQLSLAECALLASLPQAPSRLNPRRNPEAALKRRNWILDRMAIVYEIPNTRIETAKLEPLKLRSGNNDHLAPHLRQILTRRQGGNIRTTLSASLQRDVTVIVREQIKQLSNKHIQHSAVVVIHNPTGEVLALVGSPDFSSGSSGQIDATRTPRSPGSALKPFTYLLAFEKGGMTPATIIPDIPTKYSDALGANEFVNYDRKHHGPVTIHHALGRSLNVPAIRALNTIGGAAALQRSLQNFGITTLREKPIHYGLGLTLGSGDVSLLELTHAYSTLGRMGTSLPIRFVQENHPADEKKQIASYQSCWMLAQTMSSNSARAAAFGTHSDLRLPFPCAAKTGTSTDFRDNWCLGFTAEFTVGVWCGNLDNSPMRGISGITGAGPIFRATMLRLHQDHAATWFKPPPKMRLCHVNRHTGKMLHTATPNSVALGLPANQLPLPASATDVDAAGRVLLDDRYATWFSDGADRAAFALRKTSGITASHPTLNDAELEPLRILSPSREAKYLLDPDLPDGGSKLHLSTDFPGTCTWSSPTLRIDENTAVLTPGEHRIFLTDAHGRKSSRNIVVEEL